MNLKNAKSYFAEHLSIGDYYGENARIQGEWLGEGAAKLGLAGVVAADEFLALCENQHPKSRKRLTQRRDAVRRVFYDFTFSPPKSVSVAALVGADERIMAAHAKAVKVALDTNGYVDLNDMWLAALVLQHNLVLHARDKHFDHLPQLVRV